MCDRCDKHVRAERVDDGGGSRGGAIAADIRRKSRYAPANADAKATSRTVLSVSHGIPRQPPGRHAEHARQDVGLRVGERRLVRREDVGVEHVNRIHDHRAGDPGDVPDAELAVGVGRRGASEMRQPRRQRPGHEQRERDTGERRRGRSRAGARWCRAGPACRIAVIVAPVPTFRPAAIAAAAVTALAALLSFGAIAFTGPTPSVLPAGARLGVLPLDAWHVAAAALAGVVVLRSAGAAIAAPPRSPRRCRRWCWCCCRGCRFRVPRPFLVWTGGVLSLVWIAVAIGLARDGARAISFLRPAGSAAARRFRCRGGEHDRVRDRRVVRVAVDPRRRRAALPRHHAEPALRSRSADREQPSARRLSRLSSPGICNPDFDPPRPQWRDLFDSRAGRARDRPARVRHRRLSRRGRVPAAASRLPRARWRGGSPGA